MVIKKGFPVTLGKQTRCCKMAVINMFIFNLNGEIRYGNSLAYKIEKRWIIKSGGFVYEDDQPRELPHKTEKPTQRTLF